jgi:sulfotransferase
MKQLFFQASLPRAGSTLLQNIIGQNPNFYVTPTSGVLELVYAARMNYSNSDEFKAQDSEEMKKGFLSFCNQGVLGFFDAITDKPYVLDKSRGWGYHYGFLNSFYPNPKILCMVRDPRDIFASMEKNFRKNSHKDIGIVNHKEMSGTTTEKRIDIWSQNPPVGMALERLYQIIKEGNHKHIHFIKFETFTRSPQKEMAKIYNYLELPYFEHDFNNIEQITQEDDSIYGIFGDHKIQSTLNPSISNAKEILGKGVCDWIKGNYKWFYDYFKYI